MLIPAILLLQLTASPVDVREAERLVHASINDYDHGFFDKALHEAEDAYRLDPLPLILFNIGQCHRALEHWEKAAFYFHRYLQKLPEAPNRSLVEKSLITIDYKLKAQQLPAPPPVAASPPPSAAAPAPKAAVESPATGVAQSRVAPARSHALAWTLVAAGSAAAVVALVGLGEVLDFNSANSTYQASPTLANYQSATAASGRATLWAPVAIACGIGAALLGGGVAIAW